MITPAMLRALVTGEVPLKRATPEGIAASEAAGQQEVVASSMMPLDLGWHSGTDPRATFEAVGFSFGEPIDAVFQQATLPEGWTRHPTDHSMWSVIRDAQGIERVEVFYKAAFYDRNAHARLLRRFNIRSEHDETGHICVAVVVLDRNEVTARFPVGNGQGGKRDAESAAGEWLAQNWPEWGNPAAYWDEP